MSVEDSGHDLAETAGHGHVTELLRFLSSTRVRFEPPLEAYADLAGVDQEGHAYAADKLTWLGEWAIKNGHAFGVRESELPDPFIRNQPPAIADKIMTTYACAKERAAAPATEDAVRFIRRMLELDRTTKVDISQGEVEGFASQLIIVHVSIPSGPNQTPDRIMYNNIRWFVSARGMTEEDSHKSVKVNHSIAIFKDKMYRNGYGPEVMRRALLNYLQFRPLFASD